jgi:Na+-translocating ferredoxin:NAD+ oxidoreductase RnfG subunit
MAFFTNKVVSSNEPTPGLGNLILLPISAFDEKQQEKFVSGAQKLGITKINQQIKEYFTSLN